MVLVRGTVFLNTLDFVREHYGRDGHERILRALPPQRAATLQADMPEASWEPLEDLVAYMETAKALLAPKDPDCFRRMGRFGGRHDRSRAARELLKDLDTVLETATDLWRTFFDTGDLLVAERDANGATLRLRDFPAHRSLCQRLVGSIEGLLAETTLPVRVEERGCVLEGDPYCEVRLAWESPRRAATRFGPYTPKGIT